MAVNYDFRVKDIKNEFFEEKYGDSHFVVASIMPFCLYLLGIIATLETFLSYFHPAFDRTPVYMVLIIVAIINYIIFYYRKHSIYVALAYIAAVVIWFSTSWVEIVNSIVKMLNLLMEALEQDGRFELVRFRYLSGDGDYTISYSFVILVLLVSTILAIGIFYNRIVYVAAIVLPASLYGLFWDAAPNVIWLGISMVFLAGLLVMNRRCQITQWCKAWLEAVLIVLIPLIVVTMCINDRNFTRLRIFDRIEVVVNDVADKIHDTLGFDLIPVDRDGAELGVGGGMLTNLDLSEAENGIAFNLTTSKPSGNLYLKSYIGTVYENNTWKLWEKDNANLSGSGITAYNQSYIVNDIINQNPELWSYVGGLSVDNKNRVYVATVKPQNFYYMPYGSDFTEKMPFWDTHPVNPPLRYKVEFYSAENLDYKDYKKMVSEYTGKNRDLVNYIEWEKQYRKYVYDNYAEIKDDVLAGVELPFDFRQKRSYAQVDEYINTIKSYLSTFEYTLSPPKLPEGMDYVKFFLTDSKKGYCVNFASAGALLLKYAGIPARYVEGFCLNAKDIEKGSSVGIFNGREEYIIDVETQNAHAWVEVYKDGYGWVPVEFTVGYYPGGTDSNTVIENPTQSQTHEHEKPTDSDSEYEDDNQPDEDEETETSEADLPENYDNQDNKKGNAWVAVVLVLLTIIILLLIIIAIRYIIKAVQLKQLLSTGNITGEKFFKLYYYMEKLFAENGLLRGASTDYSVFEKEVYSNLECFTKEEIHDIIEMVLKAKFSQEEFVAEWYEVLLEAVLKLREETYGKAGLFRKFVLSIIKVY